jgi:DNA-binding protein, ybaB/ebfC family
MNMQMIMKQMQKVQKDILNKKEKLEGKEYNYSNSLVEVTALGNKKIKKIKIKEYVEKDDLETLEDMIMNAIDNVFKEIDEESEKEMSQYSNMVPGLF